MNVKINKNDEIVANGYQTGFKVGTDKDGAFLIEENSAASESRHPSKWHVAQAFRFVFSV